MANNAQVGRARSTRSLSFNRGRAIGGNCACGRVWKRGVICGSIDGPLRVAVFVHRGWEPGVQSGA
eukprot:2108391-Lingulodinium_polyedra.AAC.1